MNDFSLLEVMADDRLQAFFILSRHVGKLDTNIVEKRLDQLTFFSLFHPHHAALAAQRLAGVHQIDLDMCCGAHGEAGLEDEPYAADADVFGMRQKKVFGISDLDQTRKKYARKLTSIQAVPSHALLPLLFFSLYAH